jgi:hypothetical protein
MVELLVTGPVRGELAAALGDSATSKGALLAYMRQCPVVLSARTMTPDRFDPSGAPIPLAWYSDGVFAWTAETAAYVDRYDVAVPARFAAHVARAKAAPAALAEEQRAAALDAIRGAGATRGAVSPRLADWLLTVALDYDGVTARKMGDVEAFPWLYDELSRAIREGALDEAGLLNWTGQQLEDEADLRRLWGDAFPDRPFPTPAA